MDDSDTECGGCTPAKCRRKYNDGDTSSDGENMEFAGTHTDNPQGRTEGAGCTTEDADVNDSDTECGGCTPAECRRKRNDGDTSSDGENMEFAGTHTDNPQGRTEGAGCTTEDADVNDSDTECGGCTPAECRRKRNDGDTSSDGENIELAGTHTDNPQGTTEGANRTKEDAENKDVDEESADEYLIADITDEEEGEGIGDMSQLGAGTVEVKLQTVQQESYQLVEKAGDPIVTLAQHVVGCCQQPQGEIASAPEQHQGTQLQPASVGDVDQTTSQTQLPTNTSCVVPNTTSLQVPTTEALTPASTSSLLPRLPVSVVSEIQSSGLPVVPVPGDSPVVAQCNLIQVRQQFGDVTIQGVRNLNIGGTQNVGTPQTRPEEEEKPLTVAARKIRKRTESRIQSMTKDMVETEALQKVTEKLDRGATWVTIKGRPGEGKSTIAYMALKYQHTQGRQVYQVVSPEEFNEVITASTNPVIMLDDIFGDLEFNEAEWAKWRPSLRSFVDMKDPDKYTEKDSMDKSTKSQKERTKDEQTILMRTAPNKGKTIIILVGRDYVLKSSLADLGRMAGYISSPQYVVEVSSQRDSIERRKIWHVHAKTKTIDFDESTVSRICQSDCPHGFPHVCKMFVTTYEKDPVDTFFETPIAFLNQTLEKILKDEINVSLFKAMIKRDGKISGQELEEEDAHGYKYRTAADNLAGSYLKKEDDTYMFDHPSIYDSVALILSKKQSKFVIENCSLSFIHQRLRLQPSTKTREKVVDDTDLVANIPWTYAKHLARRFSNEISRSNLLHVLSHQACCNSEFIDLLMNCLKTHCPMSFSDILKLTDNTSEQSFCELLSSNKSHHLIKYIMEKGIIAFSQRQISDIVLGVCTYGACRVLTYISEHMNLDIDDRCGGYGETPLMLAAETKDSVFFNQILSLGPNLNERDPFGETVIHYLCRNGLAADLERVINMVVDVDFHYLSYYKHPVYLAIENGHVDVVELLVKRGCSIDNQKGLACALKSPNPDMMRYCLDRGVQDGGDAVYKACDEGNLNYIKMVLEKGATINMVSSDGDTGLLSSCGGNPDVVSFLLEKGASVNQRSSVTGNTPLHTAAECGSADVVNMIIKKGVSANVQNKSGDTPLHKSAAGKGCTKCVDVLLKAGADVKVQNNTGDTPLHTAAALAVGRGSTECVDLLLKAEADVNVKNNTDETPLHKAAGHGFSECVEMLLTAGANANVQNSAGDTPLHTAAAGRRKITVCVNALLNNTDETPLHKAAGHGFTKCVDMLLKAKADVNVQNITGDTPLHKAVAITWYGSTEFVELLLDAEANVNVQNGTGDTPLHKAAAAARYGSTKCVELLLEAEANVNVQNGTGDTPLHKAAAAAWYGSTKCVELLLDAEANVNVHNGTGDTPLHKAAAAAAYGSTKCVELLLEAKANVNVHNGTGDTPLHTAAAVRRRSAVCVNVLQKAGADVNARNNTGDTPLHTAARSEGESAACVDVLLEAKADVNVQNNTGDTPLHKAAWHESADGVDVLLKAGADMNVQNKKGDTPLHAAARATATKPRISSKRIDLLLKAGADVNVQNNRGDTPLHTAAAVRRGSAVCVNVLQKAGADVNARNNTGDTPLHTAAGSEGESAACVDVLLEAKADVNVQNNTGDTPLHKAAWHESADGVDVLLKAGADMNVQNKKGDAPLHAAARATATKPRISSKRIDLLLKAGADVNVQNNRGDTPLHTAAAVRRGSAVCVNVLQKAGADVNARNNTGDTPLHTAARSEGESAACVDVLLEAKADVNVQNNTGDTPLHKAAWHESADGVDVLLKAGADMNVQNKKGDTPLHAAARATATKPRISSKRIDLLLKAGADVNVQNNRGDTPLHKAAWHESADGVDVLLKAGADMNVQNKKGDAPLHAAARATATKPRISSKRIDLLLKAGADVNVQNNKGETPLHLI